MRVMVDLCVVPIDVGNSVSAHVAACQRVLKEAGLSYQMHAYGTNIEGDWDEVFGGLVALFLLFNGLNDYLFSGRLTFKTRLPWFTGAGFVTALLSALIGAVGPVLNPFYLNYNVEKEQILATKAISTLLMQLVKLAGYLWFLDASSSWLWLGLVLGLGAMIGNQLGKLALQRISKAQFRHIANGLLTLSGVMMLGAAF